MKALFIILISLVLTGITTNLKAETYIIKDINYHPSLRDTFITNQILKEKDAGTALALCVLLGPLGVHRIYLGTSKTTAIAYILTGAGFGILWVADLILISRALYTKNMTEITDNRHYFLWNR